MTAVAKTENPDRTCCGCRESAHADDLERFVLVEEMGVVFDLRRKAPGAVAWVHPDRECLRGAVNHRGFARAFEIEPPEMELAAVIDDVEEGLHRRLVELLKDAIRAGAARVGAAETVDAFKRRGVGLVLVGRDAGESTIRKFETMAHANDVPCYRAVGCAQLGSLVGSNRVAVLAIDEQPHVERIGRAVEKLRMFEAL